MLPLLFIQSLTLKFVTKEEDLFVFVVGHLNSFVVSLKSPPEQIISQSKQKKD